MLISRSPIEITKTSRLRENTNPNISSGFSTQMSRATMFAETKFPIKLKNTNKTIESTIRNAKGGIAVAKLTASALAKADHLKNSSRKQLIEEYFWLTNLTFEVTIESYNNRLTA